MSFASKTIAASLAGLVAVSAFSIPSFAAGPRYCDAYARRVANHRANNGNVAAGAILGAGAGAILGAALGNGRAGAVAAGAVIGGGSGAVIAGSSNTGKWRRNYDRAFWYCRNNM